MGWRTGRKAAREMLSWDNIEMGHPRAIRVLGEGVLHLLWYLPIVLYIAVAYFAGLWHFILIPLVPYLLLRTGLYYVFSFVFKVKRKMAIRAILVALDIAVLPLVTYYSMFLEL